MGISRRGVLAATLAAPAALQGAVALAETSPGAPPLIDELLRPVVLYDAAISPNGQRVAVARETKVNDKRHAYIDIMEASALTTAPKRVNVGDCFVEQIEWGADDRLLIWVALDEIGGKKTGIYIYDFFFPIPVRRVLSVNTDGRDVHVLFENQSKIMKRSYSAATVVDLLPDNPREVMMQVSNPSTGVQMLYTVDIYTGAATVLEKGTPSTTRWVAQHGVPVLRYSANSRGTVFTIEGRAPGETDWKLVRKLRRDDFSKIERDFDFVASTDEPGVLLVTSREEGEETNSLRTFDLKTLTAGPTISHRTDRDIEGVFIDENRAYMGAKFIDDRVNYEFADKTFAPHFKALSKFLGEECNIHLFDVSTDRKRYLALSTGPRDPGSYFLYDRERKQFDALGSSRPWLTLERLARIETLKIRTRDGAEIGAYLTVPLHPGPRPLVVMPHGGPEVRDSMDFDLFAQALAAQGWLVLQPNFRGSGGFGRSFADAGRKRWGDRMQEDVEDAIAHVRALGRVDGDRIAICGASYGGYAALMGAVRNPGLYKRVVSIAGLSDLPELIEHERREDGADSPTYDYVRRTIGDPKADRDMLIRASPRRRVEEIKAPVLLIHGDFDPVAPYAQSEKMAAALKKAGKTCTFETLKGEGHSDWSTETWKTVLTKTVVFIGEGFRT